MNNAARSAPPPVRPQRFTEHLAPIALAAGLGILCVIASARAISEQSAFSEYLNQARRCVELNDCPSRGGRTGGLPIFHGTSWIRLLSYSLRAGDDQTRVQWIILALWIVSIPVAFALLKRYLGLRPAALSLGFCFLVVIGGTDVTTFTYTNLLPLPFLLYYGAMALFVESRRIGFVVIASVALAAAVSVEMGSIVMVPFHVALVALTAPHPLSALSIAVLSLAIPFGLESTDAAIEIIRQVPTLRFAVGVTICAAIIAAAVRLRPQSLFSPSMPTSDRVRMLMIAALVYATMTIWLACVLLQGGFPAARYFLPANIPFLYLLAERLGGLGRRATILVVVLEILAVVALTCAPAAFVVLEHPVMIVVTAYMAHLVIGRLRGRTAPGLWPAVTICVGAIATVGGYFVLASWRGPTQSVTLAEGERLVRVLYSNGLTYPQLLASLQGPAADDLMSLLTERDPDAFTEPAPPLRPVDFSVLAAIVPTEAASQTQDLISAIPVDGSRSAVLVRGGQSYLDWIHLRRCSWRDGTYRCSRPRTGQPLRRNWPYVDFDDEPPSPPAAAPPADSRSIRFEVPIHTPGTGRPHIIRTMNEWPASWRIVRVNGVEFDGELPGAEIRLPDRTKASGVIELELTSPFPNQPWVWVPHMLEVDQANEHLLDSFRGVG